MALTDHGQSARILPTLDHQRQNPLPDNHLRIPGQHVGQEATEGRVTDPDVVSGEV